MLTVRIWSNQRRTIEQVSAEGHIPGSAGTNIGCAAASALFRTFVGLLERTDAVTVTAAAPEPGILDARVERIDPQVHAWYIGLCDFLIQGLQDIVSEYPEHVSLQMIHDTKE